MTDKNRLGKCFMVFRDDYFFAVLYQVQDYRCALDAYRLL